MEICEIKQSSTVARIGFLALIQMRDALLKYVMKLLNLLIMLPLKFIEYQERIFLWGDGFNILAGTQTSDNRSYLKMEK